MYRKTAQEKGCQNVSVNVAPMILKNIALNAGVIAIVIATNGFAIQFPEDILQYIGLYRFMFNHIFCSI